jgi:hypothetical protein
MRAVKESPYYIEGPAVISFSGGRTSGYMLRRIMDAHEGRLPGGVFVVFSDTGKERPETIEFVDRCAHEWGVEIHRVGYPGGLGQIIRDRNYLPNTVARFCTTEGKILPMMRFMIDQGFSEWTNVVGIRADEPKRVSKMRGISYEHTRKRLKPARWSKLPECDRPPAPADGWPEGAYEIELPLVAAGITKPDVFSFWDSSPFDLQLLPHQSNCDLCFMKGVRTRVRILAEDEKIGDWWLAMEDEIGGTFRSREPVRGLLIRADAERRQLSLPILSGEDDEFSCGVCTD